MRGMSSIDELNRERARYTKIKADKEELKLKILQGEYVKADDVKKQWSDMAGNVRKKLLALEGRLPVQLENQRAGVICEILHREIYEVLGELAEMK